MPLNHLLLSTSPIDRTRFHFVTTLSSNSYTSLGYVYPDRAHLTIFCLALPKVRVY